MEFMRGHGEPIGGDPDAKLWKVTETGLPMLLVRASCADAALARAREVDPGYCGTQRWDDMFDGSVPDGAEILEVPGHEI